MKNLNWGKKTNRIGTDESGADPNIKLSVNKKQKLDNKFECIEFMKCFDSESTNTVVHGNTALFS